MSAQSASRSEHWPGLVAIGTPDAGLVSGLDPTPGTVGSGGSEEGTSLAPTEPRAGWAVDTGDPVLGVWAGVTGLAGVSGCAGTCVTAGVIGTGNVDGDVLGDGVTAGLLDAGLAVAVGAVDCAGEVTGVTGVVPVGGAVCAGVCDMAGELGFIVEAGTVCPGDATPLGDTVSCGIRGFEMDGRLTVIDAPGLAGLAPCEMGDCLMGVTGCCIEVGSCIGKTGGRVTAMKGLPAALVAAGTPGHLPHVIWQ